MPWWSASRARPAAWNPGSVRMSNARALAEQLHRNQVLATRALVALMLNELPDQVRSRVHQAVHDGTGCVEVRTQIETGRTEIVLVPIDGSEVLWIARCG
jgi:hypothetical protein